MAPTKGVLPLSTARHSRVIERGASQAFTHYYIPFKWQAPYSSRARRCQNISRACEVKDLIMWCDYRLFHLFICAFVQHVQCKLFMNLLINVIGYLMLRKLHFQKPSETKIASCQPRLYVESLKTQNLTGRPRRMKSKGQAGVSRFASGGFVSVNVHCVSYDWTEAPCH